MLFHECPYFISLNKRCILVLKIVKLSPESENKSVFNGKATKKRINLNTDAVLSLSSQGKREYLYQNIKNPHPKDIEWGFPFF